MAAYDDWRVTFTWPTAQSDDRAAAWEAALAKLDGVVSSVPDRHGVNVSVRLPGSLTSTEALDSAIPAVSKALQWFESPYGLEVLRQSEWQRRRNEPALSQLATASQVAELLGVRRQRVHQLRQTSAFPKPLIELRGTALWDGAAVRRFADAWERKPGRPRRANTIASQDD